MSIQDTDTFIIAKEDEGTRIDKYLSSRFSEYSRSYFQYLIGSGCILLNGNPVKKRILPKEGDEIKVFFQLTPEISLEPEDIPLDILYEDEHILAVNKPAGMVVHPAPGNWSGTFVNALLAHCKNMVVTEDDLRPGIVHRLDKETSGILLAAKTVQAHQRLITSFCHRLIHKTYLAICFGKPENQLLSLPIGRHRIKRKEMTIDEKGKKAETQIQVLATSEDLSFVMLRPTTGRTHQLRVHLKHLRTPILGDSLYGNDKINKKFSTTRQLLHAYRLRFAHPITQLSMDIAAPIPEDVKKYLQHFSLSQVH